MDKNKLIQYKDLIFEKEHLRESIDYHYQVLERLKKRYIKCNDDLEKIQFFIDDIDDDRFKQIIHMRYVEGKTWLDISMFYGSTDESYSRNIFNRCLKKYNEKQ